MLKTFLSPVCFHSEDGVVWLWHPLGNLYVCLTISSCYGSILLAWALIVRNGVLSTLCHSCGFASQKRVLQTFPDPGYFQSGDGVVWLWHALLNFYVWVIIFSCCGSIPLALDLIVRAGGLSTLCRSCGFARQQRVLKKFPSPGYFHTEHGLVWLWHPLLNLYIWVSISSCYGSIPLTLGLIGRDGGLSPLCHSCVLAFQQRVLKTFPGSWYLHSEDGVVWLWHPMVNFYTWLTISSCYGSIPLASGLIGRDCGLSTLCHRCGLAGQERELETSPGSGFLLSEDGVVWLWHPLVNLYVWLTSSSSYCSIPLALGLIVGDVGLSALCRSWAFACQQGVRKRFLVLAISYPRIG